MDINLLLKGGNLNQQLGKLLPEQQLVRDLLTSLRAGQHLTAKVVAMPQPDTARLQMNGVNINARTQRPLQPGETLRLTVVKGGDTPELRIQTPRHPATSQDVLRLSLPRQMPLRDTMTGLRELAPKVQPQLSAPARDVLRNLLDSSAHLRQLSPERLQQLVQNSGLFTEARLAAGQLPGNADLKFLLLRLVAKLPPRPGAALLQTPGTGKPQNPAAMTAPLTTQPAPTGTPAPLPPGSGQPGSVAYSPATLGSPAGNSSLSQHSPLLGTFMLNGKPQPAAQTQAPQTPEQTALDRLWRLVEAGLARIQTQQAASLPADDNARPAWQLEIPLILPGGSLQTLELRIEREATNSEETAGEAGWLVSVGFDFAELGPVKAAIRLAKGRIFTTFWCERVAAVQLFDRQLPELQRTLEAAGLKVGHLAASQGVPPADSATTPLRNNLLDERA